MASNGHQVDGHEADSSRGVLNGFLGASSAVATEEIVGTALGGPLVGIAAAAVGGGVVYALDHTNIEHIVSDFLSPAHAPLSDCLLVPSPVDYITGHLVPIPEVGTAGPPFSPYGLEPATEFDVTSTISAPLVHDPLYGMTETPVDVLLPQHVLNPGLIIDPAEGPIVEGRDFV